MTQIRDQRRWRFLAGICSLVVAFPAIAQRYRLIEVGTLPDHGNAFPIAINDSGAVLAYALNTPVRTAFIWLDGDVRVLPFLYEQEHRAIPTDLNNNGDAIGWSYIPLQGHAVLWPAAGGIIDLDPPGADESYTRAFNDNLVVAGFARNWRSFIWENGKWSLFFDAGWRSMNNRGQMAGITDGMGVVWDDGNVYSLPHLRTSGYSSAYCINELGHVSGFSYVAPERTHAVIWVDRQIVDLGSMDRDHGGAARAINDVGVVVGSMTVRDGQFATASSRRKEVLSGKAMSCTISTISCSTASATIGRSPVGQTSTALRRSWPTHTHDLKIFEHPSVLTPSIKGSPSGRFRRIWPMPSTRSRSFMQRPTAVSCSLPGLTGARR